ncbi:MAG TPA: amino acid ABC transporter substrate-binding protein [Candidatus Onthocola stercorigallinarum]|nr:amino acid ABC transporter substrate-binding protein [Candidatus Onthocola stercorigallinarum]
MKKIVVLLISLLFISGCGNKDTLVMVTEAGFAPYEYYENGEIVGVDVDIAREIAKKLGKELEIKDVAFDSIVNEVKTGKADFGAAGISYNEERAEEVDFTINYATSKQIIVVRENSNISKKEDLENLTIAVQLGSVGDSYVTQNYENAKIIRQKKYLAAIEDLKTGKADCVVMDELPAKAILKENTNLKILDTELFTDSYGMIVKKGNKELLDAINEVLQQLLDEGKIEEYIINHS